MPFVESDFFIAILKDSDWLKSKAAKAYEKYKGRLWTSPSVIAELLLISEEFGLDPENIIAHIYRLVDVKDLDEVIAVRAAHFMKEEKATAFDALHAAYAQNDLVLSSDSIYDKLGIERIKFESE
jgi:predicted nucleic acid-binding protein